MTVWVLVVRTYKKVAPAYPLIEHRFYGISQAEAEATYNMHLGADAMLRSCAGEHGDFHGTLCTSVHFWERAEV
jgi:hypothetical protein